MAQLVNAVGGGDLGVELDLYEILKEIELPGLSYEPEVYPGLRFKFEDEGGTVMLFRTGKYNIAGATSIEELWEIHQNLVNLIESLLDRDINSADERFEVRNLVYLDKYPQELELSELCIALGMENTEYEPEVYPSLQYTSTDYPGIFFIYPNGKVSLVGTTDPDKVPQAFDQLFEELDESLRLDGEKSTNSSS